MTPDSFNYLAGLVKARSGIVLTADKGYMLETRLGALLKREGLRDLDALAARLRLPGSDTLAQEMTEALTTNESSFFRDGHPFEHLRGLLPALHRADRERRPGQRDGDAPRGQRTRPLAQEDRRQHDHQRGEDVQQQRREPGGDPLEGGEVEQRLPDVVTLLRGGRDGEDRRAHVPDVLVEQVVTTEAVLQADEVLRVVLIGDEQKARVQLTVWVESVGVVVAAALDHHAVVVLVRGERYV